MEDLTERGALGRVAEYPHLFQDMPENVEIHECVTFRVGGPTAEIYVPDGEGPFPCFLHLHGGGWFTGSAKQERRFCMRIAAAGFTVVNLEYALAPENPFPKDSRTASTQPAG